MPATVTLPDGTILTLPFALSVEEARERDALLSQRYFLVRQGSLGEIFRCRECRGKHSYFTLHCVERPFSGIAEGFWAYYHVAGAPEVLGRMTPAERRRVEQIAGLFRVPDLSSSHPETAAALDVGDRDIFKGAHPLGVLEEIPASLAQRYQDLINTRLPIDARLRLPGLTA